MGKTTFHYPLSTFHFPLSIVRILALVFVLSTIHYPLSTFLSSVYAAPSKYLNYQGKLTDATGKNLTGTHKLTFRIYDAETGGTKIWEESQNVDVPNGIFTALLGKSTAISIKFDKDYWMTLDVDDSGEMSPRQQLIAAAFAINTTYFDGLASSSFLRSDEADTMDKALTLKDSLTFSGVSTDVTTGSNEDFTINPSGSGNVVVNIDAASTGFKLTDGTTDWLIIDDAGNATFTSDTATDLFNIKVGNLKVGDATPTNTLGGEAVFIEGALEVDGKIYADGGISGTLSTNDGIFLPDDKDLALGNTSSSPDAALQWDTAQTQDALLLGLSGSNSLILLEQADMSGDYAHSTQTNPTLFIHSATGASSATTQWVSLAHDATNAVIATGLGDIVLDPIGNDVLPSANTTDNLGSSSLRWGTVYVGTLDATTIASGSTITHSLDAAYDDGSTITVDTGAITLNDSITSTTNALAITNTGVVSGSTSRDVMNVTSSSTHTTTGTVALLGMDFTGTVSSGTAEGINIQMGASTQNAVNTNAIVRAATLTSTASTGTAPLTVSSTTVVTNLNADTVDAISSGSFLRSDATDTFDSGSTLTVAGALSVTGQADIGNDTATVAIDSSDWNISTTGAMTRIDSIANTSADLALSTTTSGNITATPAAATGLLNVVTGNLRVGTGATPALTLDGEDAFIEGTLEVDGNVQVDGTLTAAAITATSTGTNYTWTLASGADFVIDDMTSAQTLILQNAQGTADTAVFYVKDTATANQADLVIAPSDGGVLIDTPGATELSSVTTTDAREALAITTDPSKVGGGAGADADGVIKLGVQEGAWEYIWYDPSQGTQGKFEFSAPHNVASSSPAGISFFDVNNRAKTQDFSWDPSDQSFAMSGGLFKHDFRNFLKNSSFEAFSSFEQFHNFDPGVMTAAMGTATGSGGIMGAHYEGGWDAFAPDDWTWVAGDVFQHSPEIFAGTIATTATFQQDSLQGKSAVSIKDGLVGTPVGSDAAGNTTPSDGKDGAIFQKITGLKPNTDYAIGVNMLVTNSANTTGLVDITGEYGEDTGEPATSRFTPLTTSGNATPTVYTQYKGTFKTDPKATDITIYLLCRQTGTPAVGDMCRFDTIQVVSGKVVPEFQPNPLTDTGDQTVYGSLRLGRTSNERGGILSVDRYVRTRGIELFTDDPGISGKVGGMASIMQPGPAWNSSGGAVGTLTLTTSGFYTGVDPADYQITIVSKGDAGLGTKDKFKVERRYMNYAMTTTATINDYVIIMNNVDASTVDTLVENGIKMKFNDVRGGNVGDRWFFTAFGMDTTKQYSSFNAAGSYTAGETRIFKDPDMHSPSFGKLVFQDGAKRVTLDQIVASGIQTPSRIEWPTFTSMGGKLSLESLGNYSGATDKFFEVEIAANGVATTDPDLFKWRAAYGTWSANTAIKRSGITTWPENVTHTLVDGVQIRFNGSMDGNYTEAVIGDRWTFWARSGSGAQSINADTVDTYHAASAASPVAGYLVATDSASGRFPRSVIPTSLGVGKLSVPGAPSGTAAPTGGSMATATYFYAVTATNSLGETTRSVESAGIAVTGPSGSVSLSWPLVANATGYKVYRTTTSGSYISPSFIGSTTTTSLTDTLSGPSAGAPPATNTTGEAMTIAGDLTVSGTLNATIEGTSSNADKLDNLDSTQFLRSDVATVLRVGGDASLTIHSNTNTPTADSKLLTLQTGSPALNKFTVDAEGDVVANSLDLGVALPIGEGGTGAITSATARTNLGLGTLATLNVVGAAEITDGQVGTAELVDGAVTSAKIFDGTITSADIALDTIAAVDIATGAVDTAEILDGAVTSADIALDTIAAADIATGAVTADEILDGAIANADINASAAIAGSKINPAFGTQNMTISGTITAATDTTAADSDGTLYLGRDSSASHYIMWDDDYLAESITGWLYSDEGISVKRINVRGASPATISFGTGANAKELKFDATTQEFSFTGGKLAQQFQNLIRGGSFEGFKPTGWDVLNATYGTHVNQVSAAGDAKFGSKAMMVLDDSTTLSRGALLYVPDYDRLKGKKVTVSLWARTNSGQGRAAVGISTDGGTTFTLKNIPANATPQTYLTTTYKQFTFTFDVPAAATGLRLYVFGSEHTEPSTLVATNQTDNDGAGTNYTASQIYIDGVTLVEGAMALDYGPSPLFDMGDQVMYGNLAIGAGADAYAAGGGSPTLMFGEPDSSFGTGYGGFGMGTGSIKFEQWGGSGGRFRFNRGIWFDDALGGGGGFGATLTLGGLGTGNYANEKGDIFARGRIELRGYRFDGTAYPAPQTTLVIGHDGTGGAVPSVNINNATGQGDAYIKGNLEVDGTIYGTVSGASSTTGTSELTYKIGSSADAAATDLTLQFGNTNIETLKFTGSGASAAADRFELTDSLNIPLGESYMINGSNLNFSDLAGTVGDTQIAAGAVDLDTTEVAGVLPAGNLPATTSYLGSTIESAEIFDGTIGTVDLAAGAATDAIVADDITIASTKKGSFAGPSLTDAAAEDILLSLSQTLNDTTADGTATQVYQGIKLSLTQTSKTGWDTVNLLDMQVGGTSKFTVSDAGAITTGTIALTSVTGQGNLDTDSTNDVLTTTNFVGDVTGTYNATVVGNDSHSHTSTTLPATTSYLGSTIESAEIFDGTIAVGDIADGAVTSAKIFDATIANADVATNAAIAGTKISPDFGSQNIVTLGIGGVGTATPSANLHVQGTFRTALSGTVSVTAGTASVTGVSTLFTSELAVADAIKIGTETFTVSAIASNTGLTLSANHVAGASAVTAYKDSDLFKVQSGKGTNMMVLDKSGNLTVTGTINATVQGTTDNANKLDQLDSTQFLRADTSASLLTAGDIKLTIQSQTASPTANAALLDLRTGAGAGTSKFSVDAEGDVKANSLDLAVVLPDIEIADDLTIVAGTINNTPIGATTASTGKFTTLDAAGNISMRKGDKLLLDSDDTTVDTYLIRNTGATTVSWFVDGVEIAVLKKQTEVR